MSQLRLATGLALVLAIAVLGLAVARLGDGRATAGPSDARAALPQLSAAERAALAAEAKALVSWPLDRVDYEIRFAARARSGDPRGRTDPAARTITVYLAAGDAPHVVAHDLAHEVGHSVDLEQLSDGDRERYLDARGAPRAEWWPEGESADYHVGAGDFAEVFALCYAGSPRFRSELSARPESACALVAGLVEA